MTSVPPASMFTGKIILCFAITTLIWGSTWMVIHTQLGVVAPAWSICYRFVIAGVAMFAYARFTGERLWIGRSGVAFATMLGLMQFVLNYGFVYRAEIFVTSGLVAMISTLLFIPNALFQRIFLGARVTRLFIVGSALCTAGMVLLFWHEASQVIGGGQSVVLGIAFTLAALFCASIGNVMQGSQRGKALATVPMLGWAMLIGAAMNALFAITAIGPPAIDPRPAYIGGVLYLGLLGSAVTFPLYYYVIRTIGPARAAYSVVLVPVIAMLLSTLFEGYHWTATAVAGSLLALVGLIVALQAPRTAPVPLQD